MPRALVSQRSGRGVSTIRRARAKSYEGVELNILSWPGWGDPHITTMFEERTGAKIVVKEYIGGEAMMAVLAQTPPGSFDLILSDHEYLTQLRAADQIVPLDPANYHFDQYWPEFQRFEPHWSDGQMYAVLTSFGYIGLAYNSDKLTEADVASYEILWDSESQRQVRLVRLVSAEHGLPEPLQRQSATLRHR